MMRNVEIKAKVTDLLNLLKKAEELATGEKTTLKQHDIFYNVQTGRLKLRHCEGASSQLVFYNRPDVAGPKISEYEICNFRSDDKSCKTIDSILKKSIGTKGDVKKVRRLFIVGQTRVHVDEVEKLGNFMELEVVLRPEQTLEEGDKIAKDLCQMLGVKEGDFLEGAYIDMLK